MKKISPRLPHLFFGFLAVLLLRMPCAFAEVTVTTYKSRHSLVLRNDACELVVDVAGGSLRDFRLSGSDMNPLNWGWKPDEGAPLDDQPRVMGHFLCLDRWGPPSEAEGKNGMPYHGEAGRVPWTVEQPNTDATGNDTAMRATLPLAGLSIRRRIQLAPQAAYALVTETVTNQRPLGRIYNMVQHPSIGPPFLTTNTVVDCNGQLGFSQDREPPPKSPSFHWPIAVDKHGAKVDMRTLIDNESPNVVSYVVNDKYGWVTAHSPENSLLIGYIWQSAHYPWIDLWRQVRDGKPNARGLEFGTTGLHQPFPMLTKQLRIFDRPLFEHLDAGAATTKSYGVFLLSTPDGFRGVNDIRVVGTRLEVVERRSAHPRTLTIAIDDLNP